MTLDEAMIREEGLTLVKLSRELDIGTTILWRARRGKPIDPKNARKLCNRFPGLDFEQLVLPPKPDNAGEPASGAAP